jgi:hypothetical protein
MSACILAFVIRHAKRMRCIIFSSVSCSLGVLCFSKLSHKRHDFRNKTIFGHEMCFNFPFNFRLSHSSF